MKKHSNLVGLAALLGEENEKRLKDAVTDALIEAVVSNLTSKYASEYIVAFDAIFEAVAEEIHDEIKAKLADKYHQQIEKQLTRIFGETTMRSEATNNWDATAEHCVCCGDVIPEGRQVCPKCEGGGNGV